MAGIESDFDKRKLIGQFFRINYVEHLHWGMIQDFLKTGGHLLFDGRKEMSPISACRRAKRDVPDLSKSPISACRRHASGCRESKPATFVGHGCHICITCNYIHQSKGRQRTAPRCSSRIRSYRDNKLSGFIFPGGLNISPDSTPCSGTRFSRGGL